MTKRLSLPTENSVMGDFFCLLILFGISVTYHNKHVFCVILLITKRNN